MTSATAPVEAQQVTDNFQHSVSFSIIIETENLASADLPGLFRGLDALQAQTLSPLQAEEVILVETGDVPPELLKRICEEYPWVSTRRINPDLEYYQAKMRGVELTTGEVIVLFDSDCLYNPEWLESLVAPFAREDVQMVAGETSLKVTGPYGLAMALTYIFPRYTRRDYQTVDSTRDIQPTGGYFCNNVAFKRSLLTHFPIPGNLPLYRGNCVIHAHQLAANEHTIWQQPKSRAFHAPPNGLSHFVSRFLMLGYDALCVSRFANNPIAKDPNAKVSSEEPAPLRPLRDLAVAGMLLANKIKTVAVRTLLVLKEDLRYAIHLPLALPIVVASLALYTAGLALAYVRPAFWLNHRESLEALLEQS